MGRYAQRRAEATRVHERAPLSHRAFLQSWNCRRAGSPEISETICQHDRDRSRSFSLEFGTAKPVRTFAMLQLGSTVANQFADIEFDLIDRSWETHGTRRILRSKTSCFTCS